MKKKVLCIFLAGVMVFAGCHGGRHHKAGSVRPTVTTIDGIDVSHHQKEINWKKVAEKNLSFVYVKVSDGATYIDNRGDYNIRHAQAAGLKVGVYHFFQMSSTPEDQFKTFSRVIDRYDLDLIPMVDVECKVNGDIGAFHKALHSFLDMIEEKYDVVPMIYGTNRSYNELCGTDFDGKYPLYIGRYGQNRPVVKGVSVYTIWQFSEHGRVNGISTDVDLCRFRPGCSVKDITWNKK